MTDLPLIKQQKQPDRSAQEAVANFNFREKSHLISA